MKRIYVIVLVGLALIIGTYLFWFPPTKGDSVVPTPSQNLDSDKLFQLVNEWRTQNGYLAYIEDERLCKIASDRADDRDDNHKGFREKYSSYPYVISENDIYNGTEEPEALNAWLNSPKHLENLEKPYTYSCLRCFQNDCSQIFSSFKTDINNPF